MRTATARRMTMASIIQKHGLTQRDVADGTGIALSAVSDIVNDKRKPTTGTVNRLLGYLRKYEPKLSYEDLFA
jgi:transcriptional regulator with XRE-family HTH domain